MKSLLLLLLVNIATHLSGCSQANPHPSKTAGKQTKLVGGGCEGCEAIYESPTPFEKLAPVDTLPDFNQPGPKILISGTIYQLDGVTPANDVVLYVYHRTGSTPQGLVKAVGAKNMDPSGDG
jgi:protocatechuate 3,4-dioxygenase beta subunit